MKCSFGNQVLFDFQFDCAKEMLIAKDLLSQEVGNNNSPDDIVNMLDKNLLEVLSMTKLNKHKKNPTPLPEEYKKDCDALFLSYVKKIQGGENEAVTKKAFGEYQESRN